MADTKLADLTALTTPSGDDILYIVDDPAGTPLDRKIALDNLFTRGTITADAPVLNMSQTWNNAAITFTGLKFNATDTASNAASLLMDLQVGTVSKFKVSKNGDLTFGNQITGFQFYNSGLILSANGSYPFFYDSTSFRAASTVTIGWTSQATGYGGVSDTILTRRGTANLRLGAADAGATTSTVTITIAAPGVVTWTGHGLSTGTPVVFTTTGALPTGITSGTTYYVVAVDATTFQLATSVANAIAATPTVITTSGSQSGTHTGTRYNITQRLSMQSITGVTDRFGADLFIQGSQGTGTGAGGSIIFQVAPAGGAGAAQNALATALTIDSSQITTAIALKVAESSGRIYLGGNGGGTGTNLYANGGTSIFFTFNGSQTVSLNSTGPQVYNSGSFSWSSVATGNGTPDVLLYRDAANTLALRNGTAAQEFRVYGTTDGTNSEYLSIKSNTGGTFEIGVRRTGTGLSQNGVINATNASGTSTTTCLSWGSFGGGFVQTSVGFSSASAGTYDLGATIGGIGGAFRRLILSEYIETSEMTAPASPAANGVRIYAVDNGSGKTQLMALFATGVAQQIAIEP